MIKHVKIIESGIKVADSKMHQEDKIWSRFSHDKVDIGEELAKVVRVLSKALPLSVKMRALSLGSSDEPQFRILETAFRGGLYLFDIDQAALDIVQERIKRQCTDHVETICGDYNKVLLNNKKFTDFLSKKLENKKVNLVTFHHSLYYCKECDWGKIFKDLYNKILSFKGAIHSVLMASKSKDTDTTTWLYNHFAGKFCNCYNDQDLRKFKSELQGDPVFKDAQFYLRTNRVRFFADNFKDFMAVVWMILLYPNVHKYTLNQREEIARFVHDKFWVKKRPLIQEQDHLVIYKGIRFKGLI